MTYILGSVCSDGVVLVGDRKVSLGDGTTHEYQDKLFLDNPWMVVGSSGILGLFEKFREMLLAYLASSDYDNQVFTLIAQIEKITRELNTNYREILEGQVFDVLMGIKATTGAILRYVFPFGFAEGVSRYKVIGHGEPYGSFFLKHWWHKDMTMLDVAELGLFIIRYIQKFELDNSVGIGDESPQVWLIPKTPIPVGATPEEQQSLTPQVISPEHLRIMMDRVSKRLNTFGEISWGSLNAQSS